MSRKTSLLRLTRPVTVEGRNYFGLPAKLHFAPSKKPGWFWQNKPSSEPRFINSTCVAANPDRLSLVDGSKHLESYEHYGLARLSGIDGVIVSCDRAFPPYHGRPHEVCQRLISASERRSVKPHWYTVKKAVEFRYFCEPRAITFQPPPKGLALSLYVTTIIDEKRLGRYEFDFEVGKHDLPEIFQAYADGRPPRKHLPFWLKLPIWASSFPLLAAFWRHHERFTGLENQEHQTLLEQLAFYRLGNLLGALSLLLPPQGQLAGHVISERANCDLDFNLIQKIERGQFLQPIG